LGVLFAVVALCVLTAPAGGATPRSVQRVEFQSLIDQYRRGEAEQAVAAFAEWSPGEVARARPITDVAHDPWAWAAGLLLRSETLAEIGGLSLAGEAHYAAMAQMFLDHLYPYAERSGDARVWAFCRDWFLMTLPRRGSSATLSTMVELAGTRLFAEGDPQVLLAKGTHLAFSMGPEVESSNSYRGRSADERPLVTTSHGRFGTFSGLAVATFRQALEADPDLTEARLRLGRVLFLLDRNDEARGELDRTLVDARRNDDVASAYLAALFLGNLHEHEGRPTEAADAYRQAISVYSRFPSAPLALARLLAASGRSAEAWSVVESLFAHADQGGGIAIDPSTVYPMGLASYQWERRIQRLRAMVQLR
jgi:tetratricopeptide (TPR) repeat protein